MKGRGDRGPPWTGALPCLPLWMSLCLMVSLHGDVGVCDLSDAPEYPLDRAGLSGVSPSNSLTDLRIGGVMRGSSWGRPILTRDLVGVINSSSLYKVRGRVGVISTSGNSGVVARGGVTGVMGTSGVSGGGLAVANWRRRGRRTIFRSSTSCIGLSVSVLQLTVFFFAV